MNKNGIIIIDKPADWTSHDVVAKLRGALRSVASTGIAGSDALRGGATSSDAVRSGAVRQKPGAAQQNRSAKTLRVGHGGTLDPMATGVLPVFIGRATRAAEFCENAEKEYIAGLMPGIVTDTQDITGNVLSETEVSVTHEDIGAILLSFKGAQKQIPPMYSAVKRDGKKLYELARQGKEVPREARDIFISSIEMTENTENSSSYSPNRPVYTLRIVCSKGTYIRTLCHDIGAALGCGATMSALRRLRAGAFTIDMAHTLEDVLTAILTDSVSDIILPIDTIFSQLPSIILNDADARKAGNGALHRAQGASDGKYKFYAPDGEFLLLGEVKNNGMKTIKSFFTETQEE